MIVISGLWSEGWQSYIDLFVHGNLINISNNLTSCASMVLKGVGLHDYLSVLLEYMFILVMVI